MTRPPPAARGRYVPDDRPGRRVFIAVPIPAATRDAVADLVERVRSGADPAARDVRWVRLDGLHLTLRFLGPTLEDRIGGVVEAVDRVAAAHEPFSVEIMGAGAFPAMGRPRALWLGIASGAVELGAAAAGLDDALLPFGWPRSDRPYRPHLTLARSDGVRAGPRVAARLLEAAHGFREAFEATSLTLFESVSGDGRARYVPLHEANIGAARGGADSHHPVEEPPGVDPPSQ